MLELKMPFLSISWKLPKDYAVPFLTALTEQHSQPLDSFATKPLTGGRHDF